MEPRIIPLIARESIEERAAAMAHAMAVECASERPLLVGLLNGAAPFLMDLVRHWPAAGQAGLEYDFIDVKSYVGTQSSGQVELVKDTRVNLAGRDVIVVEDIVDTGLTLHHVLALFRERNPKSLKVCSLLKKRVERLHEVPVDYCGFEIDDLFVVGFGLDFDGIYRSLNYIAVLELPDGKEPE